MARRGLTLIKVFSLSLLLYYVFSNTYLNNDTQNIIRSRGCKLTASPTSSDPTTASPNLGENVHTPPTARFQSEFHFLSYGDAKFQQAKERIGREANDTGWFKTVNVSGPEDLPAEFVAKYHDILSCKEEVGIGFASTQSLRQPWRHFPREISWCI